MAYSEKVIDHYENPRNVGSFDNNDDNVGSGMVGAPACGDVMKLQIKVNDEGIIEDARLTMKVSLKTPTRASRLMAAVPLSPPVLW
ncbi:Iron-sulfur assembly protein IscU [Salmonella enterica subsp. enterica serovar Minnesota str. A4-603]|nr:Iron-sulfur assembly protein IscU [Salmonella enterica subsp. enterica serovar Minnesota str. A4-603]